MTTETTATWTLDLTDETLDLLDDNEHYAPALTLDPRDLTGSVASTFGAASGDGTPSDIWHGIVLRHWLPSVPDAAAIAATLRSPEGQALLDRIADGHSVDWDGSNNVGHLTADAAAAWGALTAHLDTLTDEREHAGIWDAADWLGESVAHRHDDDGTTVAVVIAYAMPDATDMVIDAATTDAQLAAYATILDDAARIETVLLSGTDRYLETLRDRCVA